MQIYKYPLEVAQRQVIQMPIGAEILSAQAQHEKVCIWALVNPDNDVESRYFSVAYTGYPIINAESLTFIGTVQLDGGLLIYHVFEQK